MDCPSGLSDSSPGIPGGVRRSVPILNWMLFLAVLGILHPAWASSPHAGTYVGPVYVSTQGVFNMPEQMSGQISITVDGSGQLTDLSGDLNGSVNDQGEVTFDAPNPFSVTAGEIADNVLHASGSSEQNGTTTFIRIEARSGAGNTGSPLEGVVQVNPRFSLTHMEHARFVNGHFIAVGTHGSIATSDDGLNWRLSGVNTTSRMNGVAFGNGTYVVVGENHDRYVSSNGIDWTALPRPLMASGIVAIAFGNDVFIYVDTLGNAYRSSNGNSWTAINHPLNEGGYAGVEFINNRFVLWRDDQLTFSVNGDTWSDPVSHPAGTSNGLRPIVAYGNNRYVVGGIDGLAYSTDGIAWTPASTQIAFVDLVAHDGEAFYAIHNEGGRAVWRSVDGSDWTRIQSISSQDANAFAFGPDRRLLVGQSLFVSTDGLVWDLPTSDATQPDIRFIGNVQFGNQQATVTTSDSTTGRFFAGANVGHIGPVESRTIHAVISGDGNRGTFWLGDRGYIYQHVGTTGAQAPVLTDQSLRTGVIGSLGDIVFAGDRGTLIRHYFTNENSQSTYRFVLLTSPTNADWHWGASNDGNPRVHILVGSNGAILRSTDSQLVQWSAVSSPTTETLRHVGFHDSLFIATGNNGTVLTSADGEVWTQRDLDTGVNLVGSGPGWVVVGEEGSAWSSDDGSTWAPRPRLPMSQRLTLFRDAPFAGVGEQGSVVESDGQGGFSISLIGSQVQGFTDGTFGNGRFVLVGPGGSAVSTDGVHWRSRAVPTGVHLRGVAFGQDTFIGVGDGGSIARSSDGLHWEQILPAPTVSDLHGITYGGDRFLAVGNDGVALFSQDGLEWTNRGPGGLREFRSVAYFAGQFMAVGVNTRAYTANQGQSWSTLSLFNRTHYSITSGPDRLLSVGDQGVVSAWGNNGNTLGGTSIQPPSALESVETFYSVIHANGYYWIPTRGAIYRSETGLQNWQRFPTGITPSRLNVAIAANGHFLLAGDNQIHSIPIPDPGSPIITLQPVDQTVNVDETLTLQANASGAGPLTYRWYHDGRLLTDNDRISGTHSPELSIENLEASDAGLYQFVAINPNGSRASREARIQVDGGTIDPQPGFAEWAASFSLPPGQDGPDDDPDNDGIPNIAEYALGGHPLVPFSAQWPVPIIVLHDGQQYPAIQFTRNRNAVGVEITVRAATTILLEPHVDLVETVEDLGSGVDRVTLRAQIPIPQITTFFFGIRLNTLP